MTTNRYTARREFGSDWKVVDQQTNADIATGLTQDEAEQNANERNETKSDTEKEFSV